MISDTQHAWQNMAFSKPFERRKKTWHQAGSSTNGAKYTGAIVASKRSSQPVGVLIQATAGKSLHVVDMLRHEGIFHDVFLADDFHLVEPLPRLLIIVAPAKLHPKDIARVKAHVAAGNGLIVIGCVPTLENLLGIMYTLPDFPFPAGGRRDDSAGEGYIRLASPALEGFLPAHWFPLHAFGCAPVVEDGATALATFTSVHAGGGPWAAATSMVVGKGCAVQIAIDISLTVRHVQEGRYVDQDGIPPPDGLSPIDDGILKCEDGLVLDWTRDRRPVSPTKQVLAFMVPVSDAWRRFLVACIALVADACDVRVRKAWYWPRGSEFVALISHDSDGNDEKLALHLLEEVKRAGIHTTWCVEAPGYPRSTCERIAAEGHEVALHFDAIAYPRGKQQDQDGMARLFTREMLAQQLDEVQGCTGHAGLYSNKNHYTRWAGRTQFFEWCEALGLRVDQSKGPSKCGTLGFPFGSCHPWQPMRDDGTLIGCAEISFQSQDFGLQGPRDTIDDLLVAVKEANGVAHVIFHPAYSRKDDVNKAMHEFIDKAKSLGAAFMTSKQIAEWTYDRKWLVATGKGELDGMVVHERDPIAHRWVPPETETS